MSPSGRAPGDVASEGRELPPGSDERFVGYGIMGQPFASGHVLALRRFPHASIGDGYTSVWHGDPEGRWTMWADTAPARSCARYFGPALTRARERAITLEWPDPWTVQVRIEGLLDWRTPIVRTRATAAMSAVTSRVPARLWRTTALSAAAGAVAGVVLRAGTVRLQGAAPSRQRFRVAPQHLWSTGAATAVLRGEDLGPVGAIAGQRWLGEFPIPRRGLFVVGQASFDPHDPSRHAPLPTGPTSA